MMMGFALLGIANRSWGASLSLSPLVDRSANDSNFDGVWDTWEPLSTCLLAYNALPSTYNIRAALEFDLSALPSNSVVSAATFRICYGGASGTRAETLQFNGYAGDGVLSFADFQVNNQVGPLYNAFGPGNSSDFYEVPATSFIQSLVTNHNRYAGFMVENLWWNQTSFYSSRGGPSYSPSLVLQYTIVPEPSALLLAASAIVCLLPLALAHARRRMRTK